jgi:hypothetical protein
MTAAARAEWRKLSWEQKILTEACGEGPRVGPSRAVDGISPSATTVEPSVEVEEPQNFDAVSEPVAEAIFKALSA